MACAGSIANPGACRPHGPWPGVPLRHIARHPEVASNLAKFGPTSARFGPRLANRWPKSTTDRHPEHLLSNVWQLFGNFWATSDLAEMAGGNFPRLVASKFWQPLACRAPTPLLRPNPFRRRAACAHGELALPAADAGLVLALRRPDDPDLAGVHAEGRGGAAARRGAGVARRGVAARAETGAPWGNKMWGSAAVGARRRSIGGRRAAARSPERERERERRIVRNVVRKSALRGPTWAKHGVALNSHYTGTGSILIQTWHYAGPTLILDWYYARTALELLWYRTHTVVALV